MRVLTSMEQDRFQALLDKYARGECSADEERFIEDWYHNIGEREAELLHAEMHARVKENIWATINPESPTTGTWLPFLLRAAAITIPILACVALYMNRQSISSIMPAVKEIVLSGQPEKIIRNNEITPQKIMLADGSEVVLQPSSEIFIHKNFGRKTREVRLKGEAFFNVQRNVDKPFLVYADEVVTRVLGTSFNVRAYENDREITVAVKTGKVSVYAQKSNAAGEVDEAEIILTPNQQMVYHRLAEKISKQLVAHPAIVLPESNLFEMHFDNAQVSKIFAVLQENYGIEIRYDSETFKHCSLTTSMSDEGLYERIAVICKAIGASYSVDEDAVITVTGNGCK